MIIVYPGTRVSVRVVLTTYESEKPQVLKMNMQKAPVAGSVLSRTVRSRNGPTEESKNKSPEEFSLFETLTGEQWKKMCATDPKLPIIPGSTTKARFDAVKQELSKD